MTLYRWLSKNCSRMAVGRILHRVLYWLARTWSGSSPNALGTLGTRWTRARYRSGLSQGPAAGSESHRSSKPLTLSLAGSKEKNQENQKQPSRLHKTSRLRSIIGALTDTSQPPTQCLSRAGAR